MKTKTVHSALFGLAVGDALGVPVEFNDRSYFDKRPVVDMQEYGTHNQPAGTWSDDSSLAFCLAESLSKGYDLEDIASKFLQWYNTEIWTPYGHVFDIGIATRNAIYQISKGTSPVLCGGFGENDNGNGSLMRIIPLAFYLQNETDLNIIFQKVKEVSSITHAHFRSVFACFIYILYILEILDGKNKEQAYERMQLKVNTFVSENDFNVNETQLFDRILKCNIATFSRDEIHSTGYVLYSLEASFWSVLNSNSYEETVLKAVNLGNDTDTTGAIAGGLAGLIYGFENIPEKWKNQLARKSNILELCDKLEFRLSQNCTKIEILKIDITEIHTDAIVNAANTSLLGGGGVDGAIHRKGGKQILDECIAIRNKQGGCDVGQAVITTAGNLPSKSVIHTVGPVWNGDKEEKKKLLADCYRNSLELALENDIKTIAFPNISTGIYHFPKDKAAEIAIKTVKEFDRKEEFEKIIFVCFDDENYDLYKALLA